MNNLAVAVKRGDEAELLCRILAESNVREEYVLQEDEDGCTVVVQSFAAAWNMVETKLMNGELIFIIIMSVKVLVIIATRSCILQVIVMHSFCRNPDSDIIARQITCTRAPPTTLTDCRFRCLVVCLEACL